MPSRRIPTVILSKKSIQNPHPSLKAKDAGFLINSGQPCHLLFLTEMPTEENEKADDIQDQRNDPSNRIGKVQGGYRLVRYEVGLRPNRSDTEIADGLTQHWIKGAIHGAQCPAERLLRPTEEVSEANNVNPFDSIFNGFFAVYKQAQKLSSESKTTAPTMRLQNTIQARQIARERLKPFRSFAP